MRCRYGILPKRTSRILGFLVQHPTAWCVFAPRMATSPLSVTLAPPSIIERPGMYQVFALCDSAFDFSSISHCLELLRLSCFAVQ